MRPSELQNSSQVSIEIFVSHFSCFSMHNLIPCLLSADVAAPPLLLHYSRILPIAASLMCNPLLYRFFICWRRSESLSMSVSTSSAQSKLSPVISVAFPCQARFSLLLGTNISTASPVSSYIPVILNALSFPPSTRSDPRVYNSNTRLKIPIPPPVLVLPADEVI